MNTQYSKRVLFQLQKSSTKSQSPKFALKLALRKPTLKQFGYQISFFKMNSSVISKVYSLKAIKITSTIIQTTITTTPSHPFSTTTEYFTLPIQAPPHHADRRSQYRLSSAMQYRVYINLSYEIQGQGRQLSNQIRPVQVFVISVQLEGDTFHQCGRSLR
eukprot:TRINITY_DN8861_c0_g1_i4.p2 TRINITY_DN8861_c0_g1~~TRINITY_DN8861_c0_g1_i4.p2  ORF type:complete len:160 (+),score=1.24 TRINITY_DN8861_c0_g1_i4:895-1374(+)